MDSILEKNEIYKTMLDNACEAVFVFDTAGMILYANSTAVRETEYEDLAQISISDIYPLELRKENGRIIWNRSAECIETFAYRANRTCYSVLLRVMQLDEGHYVSFAVNDQARFDVMSSHQKAMREVEEATKLKDQFTSNITHELRTPINGIKGMAEGLMESSLTPSQEESVDIILHCCRNMTTIINDILDFAKLEAGKLEIAPREFNLAKFLRDILNMHSTKINEKGLKLMVNVSGRMPETIIADDLRIEQVINNLMSNAIKFTSEGHIGFEVSASPAGNDETELYFMIIDTGIGISPEEREKLFKSFSQVDGSITRRFGGTGLGLAITKQLVDMMGGTISVDSEKGKGSTFSFSLRVKNGTQTGASGFTFSEGSFEFKGSIPLASQQNGRENGKTVAAAVPGLVGGEAVYAIGKVQDIGIGDDRFDSQIGISADDYIFAEIAEDPETTKLLDTIEKLMISIELGSWEKAEGFATTIKTAFGNSEREIKQKAFALLLNVRKENYDIAVSLLEELEAYVRDNAGGKKKPAENSD